MEIVLDFDGTCVTHNFTEIGADIGAIPVLRELVAKGHKLILFTMRCDNQKEQTLENGYQMHGGDFLAQAVDWFEKNEIPLYGIQRNPTQDSWTSSPKAYGQLIIDDAALGCPLKVDNSKSARPFVDWAKVRLMLWEMGLIDAKK